MRTLRLLRARQDVIELLLRRGRLGDVQMMHFYNDLVERELEREKTSTTQSNSSSRKTIPGAALQRRKQRVEELARHSSPLAWLGEVYGSTQWSTSYLASRTVRARNAATDCQSSTTATDDAGNVFYLTGYALAAGEVGSIPSSVQIIAAHEAIAESTPGKTKEEGNNKEEAKSQIVVRVSLQQPGVTTTALGNELLRIDLDNAVSTRVCRTPTTAAAAAHGAGRDVTETHEETTAESNNKERNNNLSDAILTSAANEFRAHSSADPTAPSNTAVDERRSCAGASVRASEVAAHQHVLTAAAYGAIVSKLEEVCALHATHASRYDALLIRNPATQMRLTQLSCARYGIESLLSYVMQASATSTDGTISAAAGTAQAADTQAVAVDSDNNEGYIPLVESAVLNMYAEGALMESVDGAWAVLHGTPLHTAQPHRSQATKLIDYPYVEKLMGTSKYVLTAVDGAMELQALQYLMPILHDTYNSMTNSHGSLTQNSTVNRTNGSSRSSDKTSFSSSWTSMMFTMLSMSRGEVRLAMPHVNLRQTATSVEQDVSKLLRLLSEKKHTHDPCFAIAVGQYVAELFASVAVVCRCTAALNLDESGKGHREWLLAQSFLSISAARRGKVMADYENMRAARAVLRQTGDVDNYTTHPVQLMNAAHVSKTTATDGAKTKKVM